MSEAIIKPITKRIVEQLVCGDYDLIIRENPQSRVTGDQLRIAVNDYGRKLVYPPLDVYQHLDVRSVKNTTVPTWSIYIPLWTEEEGRSDLTLELTIKLEHEKPNVEIDDLHVL